MNCMDMFLSNNVRMIHCIVKFYFIKVFQYFFKRKRYFSEGIIIVTGDFYWLKNCKTMKNHDCWHATIILTMLIILFGTVSWGAVFLIFSGMI